VLVWVVLAAPLVLVIALAAGVVGVTARSGDTVHTGAGDHPVAEAGDRATSTAPPADAPAASSSSPPTTSAAPGTTVPGAGPGSATTAAAPGSPAGNAVATTVAGDDPPATGGRVRTPSSRDDCRSGGWRQLTDAEGWPFGSLGACIRDVSAP
jgi:hypothetical protein